MRRFSLLVLLLALAGALPAYAADPAAPAPVMASG